MSKYIFGGSARELGRFGLVAVGQVIDLTDAEASAIASDTNFFAQPVRSKKEVKLTTDTTLVTATHSGKRLVMNHAAPVTLTLPTTPAIGDCFEIFFGSTATDSVTVSRNGKTIDSVAANLTIAQADDSAALYWNGTTWKTY